MKRRRLSMVAAAVMLFPLSMMVAHIGGGTGIRQKGAVSGS